MKQLIYKTRPGYDCRNRCSFNRFLEMSRDGAEVTSAGRSFHMRAPATGKARCPIVGSLTTGTHSSSEVEDRNLCRDGMSAIDVNCQHMSRTNVSLPVSCQLDKSKMRRVWPWPKEELFRF